MRKAGLAGYLPFIVFAVLSSAIFFQPLRDLFSLSLGDELFSHIPLIPLISLYLIFIERRRIFSQPGHQRALGGAVVGLGLTFALAASALPASWLAENDRLSLQIFSLVTAWIGGFLVFFGGRAFRSGLFPLLFLYFMAPIPSPLLDMIIPFLQRASADMTEIFFRVLGLAYLRHGVIFDLPGISIEVARECSGIRSTIALAITVVVAAYLFLRTPLARGGLVASIAFFAVVKNAVRITSLSMLAVHVDKSFITGSDLHRRGGVVFFALTLILVGVWVMCLRWLERIFAGKDAVAKKGGPGENAGQAGRGGG